VKFLIYFIFSIIILLFTSDLGYSQKVKKSSYVILTDSSSAYKIFKNKRVSTLDKKEIDEIESMVLENVKYHNANEEIFFKKVVLNNPNSNYNKSNFFIEDITKYKRQYLAVSNDLGEKEVYVGFFCEIDADDMDAWKEKIFIVHDGGNCFFHIKLNLTKHICYEFFVNGY